MRKVRYKYSFDKQDWQPKYGRICSKDEVLSVWIKEAKKQGHEMFYLAKVIDGASDRITEIWLNVEDRI
jgi:hypothetical protein